MSGPRSDWQIHNWPTLENSRVQSTHFRHLHLLHKAAGISSGVRGRCIWVPDRRESAFSRHCHQQRWCVGITNSSILFRPTSPANPSGTLQVTRAACPKDAWGSSPWWKMGRYKWICQKSNQIGHKNKHSQWAWFCQAWPTTQGETTCISASLRGSYTVFNKQDLQVACTTNCTQTRITPDLSSEVSTCTLSPVQRVASSDWATAQRNASDKAAEHQDEGTEGATRERKANLRNCAHRLMANQRHRWRWTTAVELKSETKKKKRLWKPNLNL